MALLSNELEASPRNWPEDYQGGENGYHCVCASCKQPFLSNRRLKCKVCAGIAAIAVNIKYDKCDLYIGRGPCGRDMNNTPVGEKGWLGNPYPLPKFSREKSVALFQRDFERRIDNDPLFVTELTKHKNRGRRLGCFCEPLLCHGRTIAAFLNKV